jgi:hypothetical protein
MNASNSASWTRFSSRWLPKATEGTKITMSWTIFFNLNQISMILKKKIAKFLSRYTINFHFFIGHFGKFTIKTVFFVYSEFDLLNNFFLKIALIKYKGLSFAKLLKVRHWTNYYYINFKCDFFLILQISLFDK